jgi:hypothetical protein
MEFFFVVVAALFVFLAGLWVVVCAGFLASPPPPTSEGFAAKTGLASVKLTVSRVSFFNMARHLRSFAHQNIVRGRVR